MAIFDDGKDAGALRTIGEVAQATGIKTHVLRYWEAQFPTLKPLKRSGGRRYYRPDDVDLLRGIRRLLYGEGYTIRGVQRILREHGIKAVQGLMDGSAIAPASFGGAGSGAVKPPRHDAVEAETYENGHDVADDDADIGFDDDHESDADDAADEHEASEGGDDALREPMFDRPAAAKPVVARPVPPGPSAGAEIYAPPGVRKQPVPDRSKLQAALDDLISARALIDRVLKDDRQS